MKNLIFRIYTYTFFCIVLASGCSMASMNDVSSEIDGVSSRIGLTMGSQYVVSDFSYTVNQNNALYVSAQSGSDANDGSSAKPFATVTKALKSAKGGEVIYVGDGDYGDLRFGSEDKNFQGFYPPIEEVFTDWVTLLPWGNAKPSFDAVNIGTDSASASNLFSMNFSIKGNSDLRLRIDGFEISEGLNIRGSRYVDIRNCTIKQSDSYNNWTTEKEKSECVDDSPGVFIMNGRYIHILNNEIREAGVGIWLMTHDAIIKGNDIHNLMHDGIQPHGGENITIEGNTIHDLDDGRSGDEYPDMHVDGIHISKVAGGGKFATSLSKFTIRNNLIYHCESMGIMFQWSKTTECNNFLWGNNIFGPSGGTLIHLGSEVAGNFIIRQNTVVYTPTDFWISDQGRTFGKSEDHEFDNPASWAYKLNMWATTSHGKYKIYNNIFTDSKVIKTSDDAKQFAGYIASNLFYNLNSDSELKDGEGYITTTLPYKTVTGNIQDVIDAGKIPGTLISGSMAIDEGAVNSEIEPCSTDFTGANRGTVSIGALEY